MSLVGTRPILPDELEQYELHHRAMICSRNGRTTSIRIRNWHRRRTLTDSKAKKNRRPCLYCERNKHNRLVVRHKKSHSAM